LVTLEVDDSPVTTSLAVAESFGKRHNNVLRDIETLDVTEEFSLLNFEECHYTAQNGQKYRAYVMTRDGFLHLADLVVLDADNTPRHHQSGRG